MVRRDIAERKIARAAAWLDDAEELLGRTAEEFANDVRSRDLACFYVLLGIQECIDLAAHFVADAGWAPPDEAESTFDILAEKGVIERSLADSLRGAAGLRNRIAHGYAGLDHRRLHQEAGEGVMALRKFFVAVAAAAGL
jgi:uncharacterized protein YutE (UPF0331/DUF86 family)